MESSKVIKTPMAYFWGDFQDESGDRSFVVTDIEIKLEAMKTLRFPRDPDFNVITAVRIKQPKESLRGIEMLIIPQEMREFDVPDYLFPDLVSIQVEEGAPFYAKGVNLFSREGKLLNFFRLDRYELMEEPPIPFDPEGDLQIKGDCLMALLAPTDTLVLPGGVKRASPKAFLKHVPRRLVCSEILICEQKRSRSGEKEYISNVGYIKELVLTDPQPPFFRKALPYLEGLEHISLPNGHRIYETRDGILYKKNGATLVFIPPCHPQIRQGTFVVPEGVRRLGGRLFKGFMSLKRVEMPDSVCELGIELFSHCENLEYVRLGDSIRHIPGWKARREKPWLPLLEPPFYSCLKLFQVHFPKKLVSIGECALEFSGIKRVELPEGLEEVGEGSFSACFNLEEVILPKSLKRVGKNAFYCSLNLRIWAYEGSAKGLLSSISYNDYAGIAWLHVLDDKGQTGKIFPVPYPRYVDLTDLLNQAWDGDHLKLSVLFECIPELHTACRRELILVALCNLDKKAFAPYERYRKRRLSDYGIDLIERNQWEDFCHFMELVKPHRGIRKVLLDYCNQSGHVQYIPLLLEADHKLSKGKGRSSLEKGKFNL